MYFQFYCVKMQKVANWFCTSVKPSLLYTQCKRLHNLLFYSLMTNFVILHFQQHYQNRRDFLFINNRPSFAWPKLAILINHKVQYKNCVLLSQNMIKYDCCVFLYFSRNWKNIFVCVLIIGLSGVSGVQSGVYIGDIVAQNPEMIIEILVV